MTTKIAPVLIIMFLLIAVSVLLAEGDSNQKPILPEELRGTVAQYKSPYFKETVCKAIAESSSLEQETYDPAISAIIDSRNPEIICWATKKYGAGFLEKWVGRGVTLRDAEILVTCVVLNALPNDWNTKPYPGGGDSKGFEESKVLMSGKMLVGVLGLETNEFQPVDVTYSYVKDWVARIFDAAAKRSAISEKEKYWVKYCGAVGRELAHETFGEK